jgi:hypothetical protein
MPRVTTPLNSLLAIGTLGKQLTFRRTARGVVVTRKPRQPGPINAALRANTIAIAYFHTLAINSRGIYQPSWQARAKELNITLRNAWLKECLQTWNQWRPTHWSYGAEDYASPLDPPTIVVNLAEGELTPILTDDPASPYEYVSIHRLPTADDHATPTNVIGFLDHIGGPTFVQDNDRESGRHYYRGVNWAFSFPPTESDPAISIDLP